MSDPKDFSLTADAATSGKPSAGQGVGGWLNVNVNRMPRDGTWFEAKNDREVRVVRFDDKHDRLPTSTPGEMWNDLPTHWRPLASGMSPNPSGEV